MQTQKAENMIEHEAEIYARPPRTWFQTEKQKKESAKRGRPGADEEGDSQGKVVKKQKREEGKGKKEKGNKEAKVKQKRGDDLLEVRYMPAICFMTGDLHYCLLYQLNMQFLVRLADVRQFCIEGCIIRSQM